MAADRQFKRIAVYCGSSLGERPEYVEAARALGAEMVKRNIGLVYGGTRTTDRSLLRLLVEEFLMGHVNGIFDNMSPNVKVYCDIRCA